MLLATRGLGRTGSLLATSGLGFGTLSPVTPLEPAGGGRRRHRKIRVLEEEDDEIIPILLAIFER